MIQNTSKVIMIRPKHFNYNIETADNNYFQKRINGLTSYYQSPSVQLMPSIIKYGD